MSSLGGINTPTGQTIMTPTVKADIIFSKLIRQRDPCCVRCLFRRSSEASHFYERGNSSVRYHPQNVDGTCGECHRYWHAHRQEYKDFKWKQLGVKDYVALQRLAWIVVKKDVAIEKFMKTQK